MKKSYYLPILMIVFLFSACSMPRITTQMYKSYPPLNVTQEVKVLGISDSIPVPSTQLGTVKIEDSGMTRNCKYDDFIKVAKNEARKIGGNTIKVIEDIPPHSEMRGLAFYYYNCHQITVMVLRVSE